MKDPIGHSSARLADPDWVDLGDALWLAAVADAADGAHGTGPALPQAPDPRSVPAPVAVPEGHMRAEAAGSAYGPQVYGPGWSAEHEELVGASRLRPVTTPAVGVVGRTGEALPFGRDIARALLPFKRRVLSQLEQEPDEVATAERASDDGLWLPQMRPAPTRWLSLAVVVDVAPTMAVWGPTVNAFIRLLKQHGSFSRCRELLIAVPEDGSAVRVLTGSGSGVRHPAELVDPSGRQVILVVTDGQSAGWHGQQVFETLRLWGGSGPLAIVNPYPQRYWHRAHLAPRRVQVRAPRAVAPNARLMIRRTDRWHDLSDESEARGFPIPVLELSARWLRWWARLVTGPGGEWLDASLFLAGSGRPRHEPPPQPVTSRDLVLRFRSAATPLAFRLATHLAAAPLDLSLARRIQHAMLPQSLPHHLAEVVTSDLVRPADDHGGAVRWDFAEGVRDVLLSSATRDDSARVLRLVAVHYGDQYPGAESMSTVIETPERYLEAPLSAEALPMAKIKLSVLRALSGPYVQHANRLARSIAVAEGAGTGDAGEAPRSTAVLTEAVGTPDTAYPSLGQEATMIGDGEEMPVPLEDDFGAAPWPGARPGPAPDPYPLPGSGPRLDEADPDLSVTALFGGQEQDIIPAVWGNVPPRNLAFTGRSEMLALLDRRLQTESMTAVLPQALHGMGGVGKSQIAIEYTYRNKSKYDLVWWIPSEHPGQIRASLAELGLQLGHEPGLEAGAAVAAVRDALSAGVPYEKWLLIFDNAETLDAVRPYFPESGSGKVLVTSRNPEWGQVAQTLEVDVFTRAESIELLKRRNPEANDEHADLLADALGDLPLAVEHASAWCATTGISMPDYIVLLGEKQDELAAVVRAPVYELAVAAAWGVALDRLREENLAALRLLQVCSFFAAEPIKRELFTSTRGYSTVPDLDDALQSPNRLSQVLRDIQKYGLARIDHRNDSIQLHRLVKAVLVGGMDEEEQERMEHGAHVLLAGSDPGSPDKRTQWDRYQQLAPHVAASRMITCENGWAREMVLHVIEFYGLWGDLDSSRDLAQQAVDEWRRILGRDHQQTLRAGLWLGYVQRTLGQFDAAREIDRDCLDRFRSTLGSRDEGTIDAMGIVAADLRIAGDFVQARRLDWEALRLAQRYLGADEPMTLRAAHNLGVSLRLTGEFHTARQLDNSTYQRRVATLGDEHVETLRTLNGLTLDHRECGAYLEAHDVQEHVYTRYQAIYGSSHIGTIAAARNLAVARRRAGFHEEGRKLAEETWRRCRQRLGEDNPETIATALNFAVDLRESGALGQARELGEQTVDQYRVKIGPEHPYALYARTNLAIVLRLVGQAEAARHEDAEVFAALGRKLGPDHILTLTCAVNLASDLAVLGANQEALELDEDTVSRCGEALGADHPSTLAARLNLAFDLTAVGRREEGEQLFNQTIEAYRQVLGDSHPAVAAALDRARANCDVDPMPL